MDFDFGKLKTIVNTIRFNGRNVKEISDFCGDRLTWETKEMSWDINNPPADLKIYFNFDNGERMVLTEKDSVLKYKDGSLAVFSLA